MAEYLASIFGTEKDKLGSAGMGTGSPGFTTNRLPARVPLPKLQAILPGTWPRPRRP